MSSGKSTQHRILAFAAALLLSAGLIWGNFLVFNRLVNIRHESAPLPHSLSPLETTINQRDENTIRVGVISRFAPNVIYRLYQPIMDYLNSHSENHYELSLSKSYQDASAQLQQNKVEASFLGAWMCSNLDENSDLVPVAMPVNAQGKSQFHAVLVVPENSTINSLSDLKNQRVAVPSTQAYSGNWLQQRGLATVGLSVSDLDTIQHFKHHETVIWQVLRGNFAAGVVKESLALRNRDRGLRTVHVSHAFPGPPLVIKGNDPQPEILEMIELLLALDRTKKEDQALMHHWTPEFSYGFVPVDRDFFIDAFNTPEPAPEVSQ
ncbi:MAG: PhnD/SsuA/transferrin family substrate-binding protein [bacterium]|nr:PhnD/SsuA/transferrin family substrate-binding protein [bacterium]